MVGGIRKAMGAAPPAGGNPSLFIHRRPFPNLGESMTQDEQKVWCVIHSHVGRSHAVTRDALKALTCLPDRLIRDIITTLRNKHGKLICSTQERPGGYFIAESITELETCRNLEAAREQSVRENRQFYDRALNVANSQQQDLFGGDNA